MHRRGRVGRGWRRPGATTVPPAVMCARQPTFWHPPPRDQGEHRWSLSVRAIVMGNPICRLPGASADPLATMRTSLASSFVCLLRLGGSRLPLSLAADADVRPSCGRRGGRGRDREAVAGGPVCMVCRAAA